MSWHFSRALVAEYSEANSSDGEPSALLKSTPTARLFLPPARTTAFSPLSRFGTMFGPLTESLGVELLTWFLAASRARTSLPPVSESESKDPEADFGASSLVSLARYDHDSRSLKTRQTLLFEDSTECLLILPRWGWMHDGECFLLAPLVLHIHGKDCGSWPTPCLPGNGGSHGKAKLKRKMFPTPRADVRDNCGGQNARKKAKLDGTYIGRQINPQLQEWLMGWPIDWTDAEPLETAKFQQWLDSHGKPSSPESMNKQSTPTPPAVSGECLPVAKG